MVFFELRRRSLARPRSPSLPFGRRPLSRLRTLYPDPRVSARPSDLLIDLCVRVFVRDVLSSFAVGLAPWLAVSCLCGLRVAWRFRGILWSTRFVAAIARSRSSIPFYLRRFFLPI